MGLRIWLEKLMLALHIRRLEDNTLANQVYLEQKLNRWPGLVQETDEICRKLSVENVHETDLSSKAYRQKVLEACHKINEQRLRQQADGKQKCERISDESYGKKNYVKSSFIHEVRDFECTVLPVIFPTIVVLLARSGCAVAEILKKRRVTFYREIAKFTETFDRNTKQI